MIISSDLVMLLNCGIWYQNRLSARYFSKILQPRVSHKVLFGNNMPFPHSLDKAHIPVITHSRGTYPLRYHAYFCLDISVHSNKFRRRHRNAMASLITGTLIVCSNFVRFCIGKTALALLHKMERISRATRPVLLHDLPAS